jgi:hypothetical protein
MQQHRLLDQKGWENLNVLIYLGDYLVSYFCHQARGVSYWKAFYIFLIVTRRALYITFFQPCYRESSPNSTTTRSKSMFGRKIDGRPNFSWHIPGEGKYVFRLYDHSCCSLAMWCWRVEEHKSLSLAKAMAKKVWVVRSLQKRGLVGRRSTCVLYPHFSWSHELTRSLLVRTRRRRRRWYYRNSWQTREQD